MHPLSAAFLADKPAPNKELRSRFPLVVGSEIFSELACWKQSQPRLEWFTINVSTVNLIGDDVCPEVVTDRATQWLQRQLWTDGSDFDGGYPS